MKHILCLAAAFLLLMGSAGAWDVPEELEEALPETAEEWMEGAGEDLEEAALDQGLWGIAQRAQEQLRGIVHQRLRGAAAVLLTVILCGAVEGFCPGSASPSRFFLTMTGALSITLLTAGSLDSLIGLGAESIDQLAVFSQTLLPTLAAATAAVGAVSAATAQQVVTVAVVDLLVHLIDGLLMPLVYLYIGVMTAGAMLPENRLGAVAELLKKAVTWVLTTLLLGFTLYLSVVRVVSGSADGMTVKVAKAAISGAIPVVGGIISEATETVLAGAGMLRNSIGVFGMLGILSVCIYPFLQLGVQYLLYKLTAFLATPVGEPSLCRLIDGLAGAFGLVLGMTGACALLLLISVLSSVAAVVP